MFLVPSKRSEFNFLPLSLQVTTTTASSSSSSSSSSTTIITMSSQQGIHYGRGSNANAIHFYQLVQPHQLQDEELKLRRSFVERYWKGVSNPISLKLPNGCESKMFWEKRGDDVWLLKKHWTNFARSLRSGDQLVFKYNKGESHFDVIIFDDTALEIDYSSIKSCNNADEEDDSQQQRKVVVEEEDSDDADDECVEIISESQKPVKEEKINSCEQEQHKSCKRKINMMDSDSDADATPQNVSGTNNNSNTEDVVKNKAKKCSTTEDFKERAWNSHSDDENPNFTLNLSRTYAGGERLRIPTWFSKKYKKELEGAAATINRAGEERTWKVTLRFDPTHGNFVIYATGWKSFSQEYNLQIGDLCKFEMTQRKPVAFVITITRARDEPCPETLTRQRASDSHPDENPNFTIKLSRTYAEGVTLRIPSKFSKEHLNELEGTTATINCVGEERTWKVKLKLHDEKGNFKMSKGWKSFSQEHNLQVGDVCKFEMTQRKPVAFIITIIKARDEPCPKPLQGSEHEPNRQHQDKLEKLVVDKSRSCKKTYGSADSDKKNKFMVYVSSLLKLIVPMEFIKRYNICNGNSLELKVGEQSWLVKVRYFPQLDFWRFSEGWLEFVSGSNLKIGDNCLFELIDEKNLVFKVSIVLDV